MKALKIKALKIPEATIIRLSVYSRYLDYLVKKGVATVSSGEIAEGVNSSPAQVRKDLAYFGEFGTRGVGYNVQNLHKEILNILGLEQKWGVIIVGGGNLGTALTQYKGFQERGFVIKAIFDNDEDKIGTKLGDIPIYAVSEMEEYISKEKIKMAIVAVPSRYAQEVVNKLVEADIKAIMNFAPRVITVPKEIELRNVDLAVNLEVLTFNLKNKN